jgi:hypothetical protein
MENLELIILTFIIVILYAVFIIGSWIEFQRMNQSEFKSVNKVIRKPAIT